MKWPCIRSFEQFELWWLYHGEDVRPAVVLLAILIGAGWLGWRLL